MDLCSIAFPGPPGCWVICQLGLVRLCLQNCVFTQCCIVVSCASSEACLLDDGVSLSQLLFALLSSALIYCFGNRKSADCALSVFPSILVSRGRWEDRQQSLRPALQGHLGSSVSLRVNGAPQGHFIDVFMCKAVNRLPTRLIYVAECENHSSFASQFSYLSYLC